MKDKKNKEMEEEISQQQEMEQMMEQLQPVETNHLEPTGNPNVFIDKDKGEIFYLEFNHVLGDHYLKKLNEGKPKGFKIKI